MMLLLAVALSFVVVDWSGRPLSGVEAVHTEKRFAVARTGKDGRVALETDAPRIVIRKAGYEAVVVRPREMKRGARVKMHGNGRREYCVTSFPAPGWKAEPVRNGLRLQRLGGARHGAGPMWGALVPSTEKVWASETYSESEILLNGRLSVDARGVMPNGTHWREMGNLGETISYADVSAEQATELDKAIEALCRAQFSARVVDGDGAPLKGVFVGPDGSETGTQGLVQGVTNGLHLAFRKPGFRTVIVVPSDGLTVVMERAPAPPFPRCKELRGNRFQFPTAGEGIGFHDVDYSGRYYPVKTKTGKHLLKHGYGPLWGVSEPSSSYLQESTSYEETTYAGDPAITAARGVFADGAHWRRLGVFGESIGYRTKDVEAARRFDLMLDGVCLGR